MNILPPTTVVTVVIHGYLDGVRVDCHVVGEALGCHLHSKYCT